MINPSLFLRRALIADAVFSGVAALVFTFGAGAFASLFNLPVKKGVLIGYYVQGQAGRPIGEKGTVRPHPGQDHGRIHQCIKPL